MEFSHHCVIIYTSAFSNTIKYLIYPETEETACPHGANLSIKGYPVETTSVRYQPYFNEEAFNLFKPLIVQHGKKH